MKVDLVIKYKGRIIDVDFDECTDPHDCLDKIVETLGSEIDPEFNGYYQVNQISYWYKHIAWDINFTSITLSLCYKLEKKWKDLTTKKWELN